MKKILILLSCAIALSSCAIQTSVVRQASLESYVLETPTVADLSVSPTRVTYLYTPTGPESRSLKLEQLIDNAIYKCTTKEDADVLANVSYYISAKKGLFGKKVKSIRVTGYPAKYMNFRAADDNEVEHISTLRESEQVSNGKILVTKRK